MCMAQVTKREAADILGVTPSTVQRMIDAGKLTPAKSYKSAGGKVVMHMLRLSEVNRLAERRAA